MGSLLCVFLCVCAGVFPCLYVLFVIHCVMLSGVVVLCVIVVIACGALNVFVCFVCDLLCAGVRCV